MAPYNQQNHPPPPSPWGRRPPAAAAIDWILIVLGPILVCSFAVQAYRRGTLNMTRDGWLRFPIAFALGLGATFALAELYFLQAPTVVLTHPFIVTLTYIALAYLCTHIPLRLASIFRPAADQETTILLQVYSFWWLAAIFNCSGSFPDIRVLAFSPIFHVAALCTLLVTLENLALSVPQSERAAAAEITTPQTETIVMDEAAAEMAPTPALGTTPQPSDELNSADEMPPPTPPSDGTFSSSTWLSVFKKVSRRGPIALSDHSDDDDQTLNNDLSPITVTTTYARTQSTPRAMRVLVFCTRSVMRVGAFTRRVAVRFIKGPKHLPEKTKRGPMYWASQVLTPITLGLQLAILLMTISRFYQPDWGVHLSQLDIALIMALSSFLIVLPIAPFTHKFSPNVALTVFLILLSGTVYNLAAFPYTPSAPITLYFTQRVSLEDGTNRVQISASPIVFKYLLPTLDPELQLAMMCRADNSDEGQGRRLCEWEGLPLLLNPYPPTDWLSVNTTIQDGRGLVSIRYSHSDWGTAGFWKYDPDAPYPTKSENTGITRRGGPNWGGPPSRDLTGWPQGPVYRDIEYDCEGKEVDLKTVRGEVSVVWNQADANKVPAYIAMNSTLLPWIKISPVKVVFWRGFQF